MVNEPAKNPYIMAKKQSGAMLIESPQMTKTEMVAPTVDTKMHVVTWKRPTMAPIKTQPNVEATLKSTTGTVARTGDAPIERAYVGK